MGTANVYMSKKQSLFTFTDYKRYLVAALEERAQREKGQRLKLAKHLNCRASFVSQVLNGSQHLSLEQALLACQFLGLSESEVRFFLVLVNYGRSGTVALRKFYESEIKKNIKENTLIKNRVAAKRSLSELDQAKYYRSWVYAAIHMIVSIPKYRTQDAIAQGLGLPLPLVADCVEYLIEIGLLQKNGFQITQGERNLLIGADSPFHSRHQSNWRFKAIQSLDLVTPRDLHYSGVITCGLEDQTRVREILVETIKEIRELVQKSKDETLAVYNIDLFELIRA